MAWNRPSEKKDDSSTLKRKGFRFSTLKRKVFGFSFLAVVIVGIAALLYFATYSEKEVPRINKEAHTSRIREVKPAAVSNAFNKAVSKAATNAQKVAKTQEEKKPGVFAPGMLRLPNGQELRFKLPKEGETRQLLSGGEIWEVDSKGNIENVTPPPIFEKPFEGMISSLFERDGMVLPFALKRYSDEEVRKMCKEPTLSYDDDTPEITAKRENVVMLKKAILDFLDAGGKFEEFVDDMQQHSENAQRAQIQGRRDIRDLLQAGKGKEAVQYYKAFTQEMSEKGYGELKLPPSYRAALQEAEASAKENGKK